MKRVVYKSATFSQFFEIILIGYTMQLFADMYSTCKLSTACCYI